MGWTGCHLWLLFINKDGQKQNAKWITKSSCVCWMCKHAVDFSFTGCVKLWFQLVVLPQRAKKCTTVHAFKYVLVYYCFLSMYIKYNLRILSLVICIYLWLCLLTFICCKCCICPCIINTIIKVKKRYGNSSSGSIFPVAPVPVHWPLILDFYQILLSTPRINSSQTSTVHLLIKHKNTHCSCII